MTIHPTSFDVIVIGSGHASIEAALAPARMGLNVLMLTLDPSKIGEMSCNPAIGGTAKGQVVREIDALGGEMGLATDRAALQFRMLNRGKGPAVWSPRAQCDRAKYREIMTQTVLGTPHLTVLAGECVDISVDNLGVTGVVDKAGVFYRGKAVVVASGTFLKGILHCGLDHVPGGRRGEAPAAHLSDSLRRLGFDVGRLKTGTPMRLDGRTIDYSKCEIQPGDENPIPFSHFTRALPQKQIPCWLTHTNDRTHDIIRNNLDRSPIYSGKINVTGVRYCPSIEDKIVKFPHHGRRDRKCGVPLIDSLVDDLAEWAEERPGDVMRMMATATGALFNLWSTRGGESEEDWYRRRDVGLLYALDLANWHIAGGCPVMSTLDGTGKRWFDIGSGIGTLGLTIVIFLIAIWLRLDSLGKRYMVC
jgi:hypothetical protein